MQSKESKKRRYYRLKELGICVHCGKRSVYLNYVTCKSCHLINNEAVKRYNENNYEKSKQSKNKSKQNKRARNRILNKCIECNNIAEPNRTRCTYHLQQNNRIVKKYKINNQKKIKEYDKKKREYRRENCLCTSCGASLDTDWDIGKICCTNCREKISPIKQRRV